MISFYDLLLQIADNLNLPIYLTISLILCLALCLLSQWLCRFECHNCCTADQKSAACCSYFTMLIGVCRQEITPQAMEALNGNIKGNLKNSNWRNKVDKKYRKLLKTRLYWTDTDCHALFCCYAANIPPNLSHVSLKHFKKTWNKLSPPPPRY